MKILLFYFFVMVAGVGGWAGGQSVFWTDRRDELESVTGVCVLFFFFKPANIIVKDFSQSVFGLLKPLSYE